ncbi:hypothetical protein PG988_010500 [Apiospora saccharicola]
MTEITHHPKPGQAWTALSQHLPPRSPDEDAWWKLTGPHMAALVEAAGYPIEKQYEALLILYRWTASIAIPYLGPSSAPPVWHSQLSHDGGPIEYSWKWNTASGEPNIRYSIEPIGRSAGTQLDPLNHQAFRELLHGLATAFPSTNTTWSHHFLAALYDHDHSKYAQEQEAGTKASTSVMLSTELLRKGPEFKTYFRPSKLGQGPFLSLAEWETAFSQLDPGNAARASVHEFLASSPEGQLMKPLTVSVDNIDPAKSRMKWYFWSPHTNFASVREIMTLGGRIDTPGISDQFDNLFQLIKAVLHLPDEFPETADLPAPKAEDEDGHEVLFRTHWYYFDIAPGKALPEVKIYIQLRPNGRDDASIAEGLVGWLKAHGRGRYCDGFLRVLAELAQHRRLDEATGIQTFLACQFKNGELDLTSYLGPEAFHPGRQTSRRATLRRGE